MTHSPWDVGKSHLLIAAALTGLGLVGEGGWAIALYVIAGAFFISFVLLAIVPKYLPRRFCQILVNLALPNLRIFLALIALGLACIIRGGTYWWLVGADILFTVAYAVLFYDICRAVQTSRVKT